MKRHCYFLLIVLLALEFMACDRQPKPTVQEPASDFAAADMVVIDHGKIQFYDAGKQSLMPYEKETDSVVNVVYDENNHLFYSVLKDGKLALKCLNLSEKNPMPKHCIDWGLTLEEVSEHLTNSLSPIFLDREQKGVCIWTYDNEESFSFDKILRYDIVSRKLNALPEEEMWSIFHFRNMTNFENFFLDADNLLYYVDDEGNHCLNDKIDFSQVFDEEMLMDMECHEVTVSPDLKKVVYSATVYWGEGWGNYCVANLDGSHQRLLVDSDIWTKDPVWLSDGSLVYVGSEAVDENDPSYDADTHYEEEYIRVILPDGQVKTICASSEFDVKPFGMYKAKDLASFKGCDMAIFDQGRVIFYNSTTNTFIPFESEKDSVVNGVFNEDYLFYYTVCIGDRLYLKSVYLDDASPWPNMLTDWELKLEDCVSQTYGKTASLYFDPNVFVVSMDYDFSWDIYNFFYTKNYDITMRQFVENPYADLETDSYDEEFLAWENDLDHFEFKDNDFFYIGDEGLISLTDKMEFNEYPNYDPADVEYNFRSIDPTRRNVVFDVLLEWGDLGHGPVCFASLDGKTQIALKGTDASHTKAQWLSDGTLVYMGEDGIYTVTPDGKSSLFYQANDFVVR